MSLALSLVRPPTHTLTLSTAILRLKSTTTALEQLISLHVCRGLATCHTRFHSLSTDATFFVLPCDEVPHGGQQPIHLWQCL